MALEMFLEAVRSFRERNYCAAERATEEGRKRLVKRSCFAGSLPAVWRAQTGVSVLPGGTRACGRRIEEIRARISSHGTVLALPASRSAMRRSISWFQASSAPSSTAASRLSRREPAKAARSSSDRESAFWSSSRAWRFMMSLYRWQERFGDSKSESTPAPLKTLKGCGTQLRLRC
jgi:hypothetical protein